VLSFSWCKRRACIAQAEHFPATSARPKVNPHHIIANVRRRGDRTSPGLKWPGPVPLAPGLAGSGWPGNNRSKHQGHPANLPGSVMRALELQGMGKSRAGATHRRHPHHRHGAPPPSQNEEQRTQDNCSCVWHECAFPFLNLGPGNSRARIGPGRLACMVRHEETSMNFRRSALLGSA